ncbi:hypothetical protein [Verrucomicrobium spinosum]|uniref:hypothetical protein n=1 Tax=Verrucomicrobium spinosum TaxID=2736 RepID=UPI0009463180|nr:hypothetical protein [Verrucomicrobium spinosum]
MAATMGLARLCELCKHQQAVWAGAGGEDGYGIGQTLRKLLERRERNCVDLFGDFVEKAVGKYEHVSLGPSGTDDRGGGP